MLNTGTQQQGSELATVTAVLANWNRPDISVRAAEALMNDGVPANRIVVVDDASTNDNWLRLRDGLRACHLVRTDRNVGFARAMNIGARQLPGDYVFVVNNDAFVHRPGSVARLVRALQRHGVGVAVPKVLNEDLSLQPNVIPLVRPFVSVVRASGLSRFVPNRWQPRWATHWDHSESRFIEAANGAVMALRREVWEQLEGISERAFMYAEDIDLFWRVQALGWRAWFEADAEFIHLGNTTSSTRWNLAQRAEVIGSAERQMLRNHLSAPAWRFVIATMRGGHLARALVHRLSGNEDAAAVSFASFRGLGGHARSQLVGASEPQIEVVAPRA